MRPILDLCLDRFPDLASGPRIAKKGFNELVIPLRLCRGPSGRLGEHFVGRLCGCALVAGRRAEPPFDLYAKALGAILGIHFGNQRASRYLDMSEDRAVPAWNLGVCCQQNALLLHSLDESANQTRSYVRRSDRPKRNGALSLDCYALRSHSAGCSPIHRRPRRRRGPIPSSWRPRKFIGESVLSTRVGSSGDSPPLDRGSNRRSLTKAAVSHGRWNRVPMC